MNQKSTIKLAIIIVLLILIGTVGWLLYQLGVFGKSTLAAMESRADTRTNYEATISVGNATNQIARIGSKVKATTDLATNLEIYQDFDADKVYFYSPTTNSYFEQAGPTQQVTYSDLYAGYDLSAKAVKTEKIGAVRANKFEVNDSSGNPASIWVDSKTGLPVKVVIGNSSATIDYRNFGGVSEASITLPSGAKKATSPTEFADAISKVQGSVQQ